MFTARRFGGRFSPAAIFTAALMAAVLWNAGCGRSDAPAPTLDAARAFMAAQPRFLRPLPYSEVPAGLVDLRAESCGVCHVEIYKEWRVSSHARAWLDDPQFVEEMKKTKDSLAEMRAGSA